jgi:hypothetical protein
MVQVELKSGRVRVQAPAVEQSAAVEQVSPTAAAAEQGLTLVHFSAQRKQIFWGTFGCMIFPQSIEQGDTGRCDRNGLG